MADQWERRSQASRGSRNSQLTARNLSALGAPPPYEMAATPVHFQGDADSIAPSQSASQFSDRNRAQSRVSYQDGAGGYQSGVGGYQSGARGHSIHEMQNGMMNMGFQDQPMGPRSAVSYHQSQDGGYSQPMDARSRVSYHPQGQGGGLPPMQMQTPAMGAPSIAHSYRSGNYGGGPPQMEQPFAEDFPQLPPSNVGMGPQFSQGPPDMGRGGIPPYMAEDYQGQAPFDIQTLKGRKTAGKTTERTRTGSVNVVRTPPQLSEAERLRAKARAIEDKEKKERQKKAAIGVMRHIAFNA